MRGPGPMNADELERSIEKRRLWDDMTQADQRLAHMRSQEATEQEEIARRTQVPRRMKRQPADDPEPLDRALERECWNTLSRIAHLATEETRPLVFDALTHLWSVRHFRRWSSNAKTHSDFLRDAADAIAKIQITEGLTRAEKRSSLPERLTVYYERRLARDTAGERLRDLRNRLSAWWSSRWDQNYNPDAPRI